MPGLRRTDDEAGGGAGPRVIGPRGDSAKSWRASRNSGHISRLLRVYWRAVLGAIAGA